MSPRPATIARTVNGFEMSRYQDRVEQLELPATVESIVDKASQLEEGQREQVHQGFPQLLDRLDRGIEAFHATYELTDHHRWWPGIGEEVQTALNNVSNHVQSFLDDGDLQHWAAIDAQLDSLFQQLGRWPVTEPHDVAEAIGRAAESYTRSLGQRTKQVRDALDAIEERGKETDAQRQEVSVKLDAISQAADEKLAAVEAELTAVRDTATQRLDELEQQIKADKSRLDKAISQYQQQFSTAQEERSGQFRTLLDDSEEALKEIQRKAKADVADLVSAVGSHEEEAKKLVEVLATTTLTHGHKVEADAQRRLALMWAVVAFILGLGAIGVALYSLRDAGDSLSAVQAIRQSWVGLVPLGLAGYAANLANDHRRREKKARDLEVHLQAIGPFLEGITEDNREVMEWFVHTNMDLRDAEPLTKDQVTAVQQLIQQLSTLVRSPNGS